MADALCSQARMEVRAEAENGGSTRNGHSSVCLSFYCPLNRTGKKMALISKIHFIDYEDRQRQSTHLAWKLHSRVQVASGLCVSMWGLELRKATGRKLK